MTDMIVGEVRTRYFGGLSNMYSTVQYSTLEGSLETETSVDLGNDV